MYYLLVADVYFGGVMRKINWAPLAETRDLSPRTGPPKRKKNAEDHVKRSDRIIEGRLFKINKTQYLPTLKRHRRYMQCSEKGCKGSATMDLIDGQNEWIGQDRPGSHSDFCVPYTDMDIRVIILEEAIEAACRKDYHELRALFDLVCLMDMEAATQISFQDMLQKMKRWRKDVFPANIKTIPEFYTALTNATENFKRIQQGVKSEVQVVMVYDGSDYHLVFIEKDTKKNFKDVKVIVIDCTWYSCPKFPGEKYTQLLDVMIIYKGHALCIGYAVMTRKTKVAYTSVLGVFAEHVDPDQVDEVHTDYEAQLYEASEAVFKKAILVGCKTHYDRAFYRNLKKLKLGEYIKTNDEARTAAKRLIALPFLPHDDIIAGFVLIVRSLPEDVFRKLKPALKYTVDQWLTRVGPERISVYKALFMTTNVIESNHARTHHLMRKHPPPWLFLLWELYEKQQINVLQALDMFAGLSGNLPGLVEAIEENDVLDANHEAFGKPVEVQQPPENPDVVNQPAVGQNNESDSASDADGLSKEKWATNYCNNQARLYNQIDHQILDMLDMEVYTSDSAHHDCRNLNENGADPGTLENFNETFQMHCRESPDDNNNSMNYADEEPLMDEGEYIDEDMFTSSRDIEQDSENVHVSQENSDSPSSDDENPEEHLDVDASYWQKFTEMTDDEFHEFSCGNSIEYRKYKKSMELWHQCFMKASEPIEKLSSLIDQRSSKKPSIEQAQRVQQHIQIGDDIEEDHSDDDDATMTSKDLEQVSTSHTMISSTDHNLSNPDGTDDLQEDSDVDDSYWRKFEELSHAEFQEFRLNNPNEYEKYTKSLDLWHSRSVDQDDDDDATMKSTDMQHDCPSFFVDSSEDNNVGSPDSTDNLPEGVSASIEIQSIPTGQEKTKKVNIKRVEEVQKCIKFLPRSNVTTKPGTVRMGVSTTKPCNTPTSMLPLTVTSILSTTPINTLRLETSLDLNEKTNNYYSGAYPTFHATPSSQHSESSGHGSGGDRIVKDCPGIASNPFKQTSVLQEHFDGQPPRRRKRKPAPHTKRINERAEKMEITKRMPSTTKPDTSSRCTPVKKSRTNSHHFSPLERQAGLHLLLPQRKAIQAISNSLSPLERQSGLHRLMVQNVELCRNQADSSDMRRDYCEPNVVLPVSSNQVQDLRSSLLNDRRINSESTLISHKCAESGTYELQPRQSVRYVTRSVSRIQMKQTAIPKGRGRSRDGHNHHAALEDKEEKDESCPK